MVSAHFKEFKKLENEDKIKLKEQNINETFVHRNMYYQNLTRKIMF